MIEDELADLGQHQEGEGSNEPFRLKKVDDEDELVDLVQHPVGGGATSPLGSRTATRRTRRRTENQFEGTIMKLIFTRLIF